MRVWKSRAADWPLAGDLDPPRDDQRPRLPIHHWYDERFRSAVGASVHAIPKGISPGGCRPASTMSANAGSSASVG